MSQWIPLFILIMVAIGVSHYEQKHQSPIQPDSHTPAQILTVPGFKVETAALDPHKHQQTQGVTVTPDLSRMDRTAGVTSHTLEMPAVPHPMGGDVEVEQAQPVWPLAPLPKEEIGTNNSKE